MNPGRFKNRQDRIWLNVGGGNYFIDDFVNVDSNFLYFLAPFYPVLKPFLKAPAREWLETYRAKRKPGNFLFANCRYPLKFPADSVDHILISHFLEHLHHEHAMAVLRNYFAILRPGGTLHIIVPDLALRAREYVSKIGDPAAADIFIEWTCFEKRRMPRLIVRLLRVTGLFDLEHCWLYDEHSLGQKVREVGFNLLEKNDSPSATWRRDDLGQVNILVQKPAA
jgi:predicted SAM-dependent methyltransferase